MTIDINELRRKVNSTDFVDHIDLHASVKTFLSELIDRLEDEEKEIALKERVIDALGSELNAVANERDALRARIEQMGRQEPVAWMNSRNGFICKENKNPDYNVPLYALPGAQPETSVPDGYKLVPIEPTQEIRDAWTSHMHESFRVAYQAMIDAALEAKP